jgi:hypothetical protein
MTNQDSSHLEVEHRGAVLIVRVDGGPHSLFGVDVANELDEVVDRVNRDPSVHAVVFTGARPAASSAMPTCTGQAEGAAVPTWPRAASAVLRLARGVAAPASPPVLEDPTRGAAQLDRPTHVPAHERQRLSVAALNGSALGLGAEFAWACAAHHGRRGLLHRSAGVLLGIMPGGGGSQRLTRLIGTPKSLVAILEGSRSRRAGAGQWGRGRGRGT